VAVVRPGGSPLVFMAVVVCAGTPGARAGGSDYLYVARWTTRPDQDLLKNSAYTAWSRTAIPRCLSVPGLSGPTTYRAAAGEPHVITLIGFPSFAALAAWRGSRELVLDTRTELWGPNPLFAAPPAGSDASKR